MHIVYLLTFPNRVSLGLLPNLYIGSKSNCTVVDGIIFDSSGKKYYSSSEDYEFLELVKSKEPVIAEIIFSSEDSYTDILLMERDLHISEDVVANTRYFNKSIATINSYTDPNYSTVRHIHTNKCVRLPRDHHMILSGEYIGVTSGYTMYNNGMTQTCALMPPDESWIEGILPSNILFGEDNGFYGKTHTQESKDRAIATRDIYYKNNPDEYDKLIKLLSVTATKTFKGVPLSKERRLRMIGNGKDHMMIINKLTSECIKIPRVDLVNYDSNIWINTYANSRLDTTNIPRIICPHCQYESDEGNLSFHMWHMDNCRKNPNYIDLGTDVTCTKCATVGKSNNRGFIGHHFEFCTKGIWQPWNNYNSVGRSSVTFVYSKLGELYDFIQTQDMFVTLSMKARCKLVRDKFGLHEKRFNHVLRNSIYNIVDCGYNPYINDSWLIFKEGIDNENCEN
jgi:hypothetical protein